MKDKKCKTEECKNLINSKYSKSGLCGKCLQKKWREEHREELRVYALKYRKKYYQENYPEIYRVNREYYLNHKKEMDIHRRRFYDENKEEMKKRSKKDYEENKEEIQARHLEYSNKRYKEDEGFRVRKRLGTALGGGYKALYQDW